ncbi:hypothetical protein AA0113_g12324 [Alternaria arborescens]|uniref:Uncharacterized protein n=1 Tax=Alternaria arborescens TaxID=156630 RepID=A0A4Q4PXE2_9PLEO|nr:hypothetical protein AA0113_g12324 [Alternaria arborescens]
MFLKQQAALLAGLLPLASAYRLVFYTGFDCNGERLRARQAVQDGTCYDPSPLGSQTSSVLIVAEDGDDPLSTVVFFPNDVDCALGEAISTGNTGCVNVYQGDSFGGFTVISGETKRREVQEEAPISAIGITHGDFFEMDGELWRWNQIAQDTFSGVKPEDWSGTARLANFAPLEYGRDFPFNFTQYDLENPSSSMMERAVTAASGLDADSTPNSLREAEELFERQDINAAKPAAESIWNFLKNPYVSSFTVGLATGAIGARYFGSAPDCIPGPESDAVRTTINEGTTTASRVSAIRTDVLAGSNGAGTLTTVIVPPDQRGTGICNTPVTDPSPTRFALSRHKRSLYAKVPGFEEWLKTKNSAL